MRYETCSNTNTANGCHALSVPHVSVLLFSDRLVYITVPKDRKWRTFIRGVYTEMWNTWQIHYVSENNVQETERNEW